MTVSHSPQNQQPLPASKRRPRQLSSMQVTFAAILSIGLMLVLTLSNRIQADRELQEIHDKVVQEIELLRREQTALLTQLNFVRSDAYVESWAHHEGKLVREGEVLIIPVSSGNQVVDAPTTQIIVPIDTKPPDPESWQLWWNLFFDSDPPEL